MTRWGIFDTVDQLWCGVNEAGDGPKVFDEAQLGDGAENLARLAAHIAEVRAGWPDNRLKAMPYDGAATRVRDEVPLQDTTLNVLRKLERGAIP